MDWASPISTNTIAASPLEKWARLPWLVLIAAALLTAIGILSIARGDELVGSAPLAPRQLRWATLSLLAVTVTGALPLRFWLKTGYLLFGISLLGLIAVYFFPARNGAHRWIPLGSVTTLQPSELAKIAFILSLARFLTYRQHYRHLWGLVSPLLVALVPVLLILKEPDLGTSLLFFPVLFAMLFAAGARWQHLWIVAFLGIALLPFLWTVMSAEQRSRVTTLFQQSDGRQSVDHNSDGYQLHQSKQMLALGGLWGSDIAGLPITDPRAYHLPEARTDFIFCLAGERWGISGTLFILATYLLLFLGGIRAAARTLSPFGRLVAVGVTALLAVQAVVNSGMAVGLLPVTGLTLPFVSHGGSSLLTTCAAIGLLVSVARSPEFELAGEPFRFHGSGSNSLASFR